MNFQDDITRDRYAHLMIFQSIEDYIGSRCCILNKLGVGFSLASQAIEKILKAAIALESNNTSSLCGIERHNPFSLKQELKPHRDYYLDQYDSQLKLLFGHFQTRYPDNKNQSNGSCSNELFIIDEIFISIFLSLPITLKIKRRLGNLIPSLTEDNPFWIENKYWLVKDNLSISKLNGLIDSFHTDL